MTKKKAAGSALSIGGVSLLVVFAVLCLTVFALLSLSTVRASARLGSAAAQAIQDYYRADCQAQEILASLRRGEAPDGVEEEAQDGGRVCRYSVPISETQQLEAEVRLDPDGGWTVLRWQAAAVGQWEADDTLEVWDGVLP